MAAGLAERVFGTRTMTFDRSQIDEFERGTDKITSALRGLSREELHWLPPAGAGPEVGRWTIHQVVIHLMDSDVVAVHRMKRVIAEDAPLLIAYDENGFVRSLFYEEQSAEAAITIMDLNRREFARVLRRLPDSAFDRAGVHNQAGKVTLGDMVGSYVRHVDGHLNFVRAKRAALGKPLAT
jgi:hypothetical protein